MSARPGAVEVELDPNLGLGGVPLDDPWRVRSGLDTIRQLPHRAQERVGLLGRAGGDPQPAGEADVADQHALVEQGLPDRLSGPGTVRRGRSWRRCRPPVRPSSRSSVTIRSRCALIASTWPAAPARGPAPPGPRPGSATRGGRAAGPAARRRPRAGSADQVAHPYPGEARTPCSWSGSPPAAGSRGSSATALRVPGRGRTRRTPRRRSPCPGASAAIASIAVQAERGAGRVVRRAEEDEVGLEHPHLRLGALRR